MAANHAPLETWVSAMTDTVGEIAGTSLGYPDYKVVDHPAAEFRAAEFSDLIGAYITVLSQEQSLNLGFLSDSEGCTILAKALLGMAEEETLPEADVADSMRELVNILAGGVKRRMIQHDGTLQLGLPLVIHGRVAVTDIMETAKIYMDLGAVTVKLHVIRHRQSN